MTKKINILKLAFFCVLFTAVVLLVMNMNNISVQGSSNTYQAEDGSYGGGAVVQSSNSGYNGTGYVNFDDDGSYVEWSSVDGGDGGSAVITIRYANGSTDRTGLLIVNGDSQPLTTESTGSFSTWDTIDILVPIDSGTSNTIRIETNGEDLGNVDEITVQVVQTDTTTHQAEDGSYGGGTVIQSSNPGYNGTGYANFDDDGSYVEWSSVDGGDDGTVYITIRYANGSTDRTGLLKINGDSQSLTTKSTGSFETWDTMYVSVTLNSGTTNTIRIETNGEDLGNVDEIKVVTQSSATPTPTNTSTPTPTSTNTPTPTPSPTPTPTPVAYQAEDGSYGGGTVIQSSNPGYNGTGYANFDDTGSYVEWSSVDGGDGGSAVITIRYANGSTDRTGLLIVNGDSQPLTTESTGSFETWDTMDILVPIDSGTSNTIRIETNGEDLGNVDEITVQVVQTDTTTHQAEDGSYGGGTVIQSSNSGYNGTGYANFDDDGSYVEWSNVDGGDDGTAYITIRFCNGDTDRTGLLIVNSSSQSLTTESTGSFETWDTMYVSVTLNSGTTNTIRIETNGEDLGNVDEIKVVVPQSASTTPTPSPTTTNTPTPTPTSSTSPSPTSLPADTPWHESGGYGTDTLGGLEGSVIKVTNTNASGTGSLKEALEASGKRLIVFEVGGVIDLNGSKLFIRNPNCTVAGETAPSPGITIIRGKLSVKACDVVISHIAVRGTADTSGMDCVATSTNSDDPSEPLQNVVFDHVSATWATDECMSIAKAEDGVTNKNITFYKCLIAEGLDEYSHSAGTLVNCRNKNLSFIGNMWAHNDRRNARLKGNTESVFVNNVVYNWGDQVYSGSCLHMGNDEDVEAEASVVGNVVFAGLDSDVETFVTGHKGETAKAYLEDNLCRDIDGNTISEYDNNITVLESKPLWPTGLTAKSSLNVWDDVLRRCGARAGDRDDIDDRIVKEMINRNGRIKVDEDNLEGLPNYSTTTTSHNNIPGTVSGKQDWLDDLAADIDTDRSLDTTPLANYLD